jgi:hypothetical protein
MNQRAKRVLLAATLPLLSGEALAQDAYLARCRHCKHTNPKL